jgi:hypothetical protein
LIGDAFFHATKVTVPFISVTIGWCADPTWPRWRQLRPSPSTEITHRTAACTLALTTEVVSDGQLAGTGHGNQVAIGSLNVLQVVQTDIPPFFTWTLSAAGTACRTTDVERTHGQLGTRLTDRLGSDNADLHRCSPGDREPGHAVALGADAVAGFAADRRTHDHFVDAVQLDELDPLLVEQGAGRNDDVLGPGLNTSRAMTRPSTLTQRLDNVAAFDVRSHQQAVLGAAIDLGHHQILRNVHQTTSQVTGVRSSARYPPDPYEHRESR